MKNWIPLLLLAGVTAGDPPKDLPQEQKVVLANLVMAKNLTVGRQESGYVLVQSNSPNIIFTLMSADHSSSVGLSNFNGEPFLTGRKGNQSIGVPLFALAELLGIQPVEVPAPARPAN